MSRSSFLIFDVLLLLSSACDGSPTTSTAIIGPEDIAVAASFFQMSGPLLIACPAAAATAAQLLLWRRLSVTAHFGRLNNATEAAADFGSYLLCADSGSDDAWRILEQAGSSASSSSRSPFRKQLVVLCGGGCQPLLRRVASLIGVGDRVHLVDVASGGEVSESYAVGGRLQTRMFARMSAKATLRAEERGESMNRRRANLQGAELVTLVEAQLPYTVFTSSYEAKSK